MYMDEQKDFMTEEEEFLETDNIPDTDLFEFFFMDNIMGE